MPINHVTVLIAVNIPTEAPHCHGNEGDARQINAGELEGQVVRNGVTIYGY